MAAIKALIAETDGLSSNEKEALNKGLDEVVRDTPLADAAVIRVKKLLPKAGQAVWDGVKDLLVKVATETVKAKLGI
jgi:hypothetical protein